MPLTLSGDGSIGPLSATEVGYLDGVTSAVQTQINSKAASLNPVFTGEINGSGINISSLGVISGGFGSYETGGVTNWNDASNARSGNGYTLLLGTATNGCGTNAYFHPFSFEYNTKNGTGNMTQFAVGYNVNELWMRYRYSNTWSSWVRL